MSNRREPILGVSGVHVLVFSALLLLFAIGPLAWSIHAAYAESLSPLEKLAGPQFPSPSDCEKFLLRAAHRSHVAYCGPTHSGRDPVPGPEGAPGTQPYDVRAELVRWLAVNPDAVKLVDPAGIWLFGARLVHPLDLSNLTVAFPLGCVKCRLMEDSDFAFTQIPFLNLNGSQTQGIRADGLTMRGDIFLRSSGVNGEVSLLGAD